MKADLTSPSGVRRELAVEVPASDLESDVREVVRQIATNVKLPGFRAGKVPHNLVRKQFRKQIEGELLERVIPRLTAEALKDSESRLSLALSGANQGTWDWDIKTGEVVLSERWVEMLGYEVGELAPNISTWESLLHPEDKDRVMQLLNRHFEDDAATYETEFRLKTRSGEWKWIDARGKVSSRDEDNRPLRMVGTHIDVNRRKQDEQMLRRYAGIVSSSSDMMALLDADCVYLAVNDAYLAVWGKAMDQIVGHSAAEVFGWGAGNLPGQECSLLRFLVC